MERLSGGSYGLVLPVLFHEYLAISLTRSLLPGMMVDRFGGWTYLIVGLIEAFRGVFAFIACPLFGKLSDRIGRKPCLLVSVIGTTLPSVILAFTQNMIVFSVFLCLSGLFSATFPLVFAYIADCVEPNFRAAAYGLALATFGLSFCIGPLMGGYLAAEYSPHVVFVMSLVLAVIDVFYILFVLPETVKDVNEPAFRKVKVFIEYIPNTWNIRETFKIFRSDPFMSNLALIVFMYYTSLWAVVSTLMVYVTRKLHFSPIVVGYFLSTYGLCTMVSEGVLVRILIPRIGELNAVRIGLLAFAVQTVILAFSTSQQMIFASLFLSLLSNLVYPSISSLVSKSVPEKIHGEALGTLNGIKALTEGVGPLAFGGLMYAYENAAIPGAPYLLATVLVLWAWLHTFELPKMPEIYLEGAEEGEMEASSLISRGEGGGGGRYQAADTERLLSSDPDSGLVEHAL